MASGITTAFWGMTINNYDATDLAMVQNGYPDYCREIVYTLEEGEEGTPHIQAWIKLQRQQRLSFVKRLFPRGHFKPLTSDVYIANTKAYVQKDDETTRSAHVHKFNDPLNTIESLVKKVVERMIEEREEDTDDMDALRTHVERWMVIEDYKYAKIFVSTTYRQMWRQFGNEMYQCLFVARAKAEEEEHYARHTHTHTHTHEKKSLEVDIPTTDGKDTDDEEDSPRETDGESEGEDHEDDYSSEDEGHSESGSDGSGEETDCSGDRE